MDLITSNKSPVRHQNILQKNSEKNTSKLQLDKKNSIIKNIEQLKNMTSLIQNIDWLKEEPIIIHLEYNEIHFQQKNHNL